MKWFLSVIVAFLLSGCSGCESSTADQNATTQTDAGSSAASETGEIKRTLPRPSGLVRTVPRAQ